MMSARKPLVFDVDAAPASRTSDAAEAAPVSQARKQVGARVDDAVYRKLKAHAALRGVKVQELVQQAITEFLANHPA